MTRLIPGKIRNQGIELYEQGLVTVEGEKNGTIQATVDQEAVAYSYEDVNTHCQCAFFARKGYCQHIAALEYYLKNNQDGKVLSEQLAHQTESKEAVRKLTSFGSLFLDNLAVNEDDTLHYRLSATGVRSPFSADFWWNLKINRLPDERSYVIRDIKAFLAAVQKEAYYQIGKNYFEPLSLVQFDAPSQELIRFLWKLASQTDKGEQSVVFPNHGRNLFLPSGFLEEGIYLLRDLYDFTFEGPSHTYNYLEVLPLSGEAELFTFIVEVHRNAIELQIKEKNNSYFFDNEYVLYHDTFYHLTLKQRKMVSAIRSLPIEADLTKHVHFDLDDQAKLAASLLDFQELGRVEAPKSFLIHDFQVTFFLDQADDDELLLNLAFDYGDVQVTSKSEHVHLPFASHFKKEEKINRALAFYGFKPGFATRKHLASPQELYQLFTQAIPYWQRIGKVVVSERLEKQRLLEIPQVAISRKGGLLDISFDFSQIVESDIDAALAALFSQDPYFVSQTGKLVVFDEESKRVSQTLQDLRAKRQLNGHFQVEGVSAMQVSQLFADTASVHFSEDLQHLVADLTHPERYTLPDLQVNAQLRDYQLHGVKWLSTLDKYGFGGVLADDMGLGKTLQTIAFLTSKIEASSQILILAPSSLLYNWLDEFTKFAPQVDAVVAYGLKQTRDQLILENHTVTITSYSSFRQDFELYQQKHYDYLILDEAQVIKNDQTKIAQSLRQFTVTNCFALSGTPIENKLLEIWSIFQMVLPGLLPDKKDFLKWTPKQVAKYIQPFVMRRKKEDVLPELPELIEMTYSNEMSEAQKTLYLAQLRQMQERIRHSSDADINRHKIEILSGITRLRQICDTPSLFMPYQGESGKLESLKTLLTQIKENGHRALIFSQFRGMLDIAEQEMQELGLTSYKITGSTPANERQEMTRAFNSGSKDTFLVSLKAGGVGLNLTGADTVVLIDLWWNPAVEMQAISRAHRLGQKENVEVYRLITRGTIEEKILELQEDKRNLVTTVLDGNESRASMSIEDIKDILGISS
ncbi:DEAD/DEAH box helicase [Streptococcus halichoeri]|uniref:DEAD/DEAH box helicase n=1 Tax=Streptococcus halichoeri TaxID=254785 RepID=UPI00135A6346|nr:DEAD/DEAH box helicase [Streptococcus halichoeri]